MTEKTKHKFKPGTGFIYYGIIMVVFPLFVSIALGDGSMNVIMMVMLLAGAACIIIGAVKKSNLK